MEHQATDGFSRFKTDGGDMIALEQEIPTMAIFDKDELKIEAPGTTPTKTTRAVNEMLRIRHAATYQQLSL